MTLQGDDPMALDPIVVRDAQDSDAEAVVRLIQELAEHEGWPSPITPETVVKYLATPGNGLILAQCGDDICGLLSYSIQANLYHAAAIGHIDELVVSGERRGQGVGSALMTELMDRLRHLGCAEVSVTVMPENLHAQKFYRAHGLVEEVISLEKHFEEKP